VLLALLVMTARMSWSAAAASVLVLEGVRYRPLGFSTKSKYDEDL
jgi:hypothetical protein